MASTPTRPPSGTRRDSSEQLSSSNKRRRKNSDIFTSALLEESPQNTWAASSSTGARQPPAPARRQTRRFRDHTTLRLALVELMQELFMESMRDGELSNYERNTLQMAAIVLSQMHKKSGTDMHVSMAGESMVALETTFPEVAEFMTEVSKGMKEHFLGLKAKGTRTRKQEDNSMAMQGLRKGLEWVIRATGTDVQAGWTVTPEELLACCREEEDEEDEDGRSRWLLLAGAIGWLAVAYRIVFVCFASLWRIADDDAGPLHIAEMLGMGLMWTLQLALLAVVLDWLGLLRWLGKNLSNKFMMKTRFLDMYKHRKAVGVQAVRNALTFFSLCFAYVGLKSWFDVVIVFLQIRVMLCFASALPLLGRVVYPVCFLAEQVMEWKKDHWLLGCLESGKAEANVGAMSFAAHYLGSKTISLLCIPGVFCAAFGVLLTWPWHHAYGVRFYIGILCCILVGIMVEVCSREAILEEEESLKSLLYFSFASISIERLMKMLLDFMISTGMCTAYGALAETADRVVQPILMLRSLKLGSDIRLVANSLGRTSQT